MIAAVNTDMNSDNWKTYRSFFVSTNAMLELDLSESSQRISFPGDSFVEGIDKIHTSVPFVLGKIKDFKPTIRELKMFKGDEEHRDEADKFNEKLIRYRE